jgi:hypothetical protein
MGVMKELAIQHNYNGDIWTIGDKDRENPHVGETMRVTWLKQWGGKPAGFQAVGTLKATFCVAGRTLIGELLVGGAYGHKALSCPWSKRWIDVEVLDEQPLTNIL